MSARSLTAGQRGWIDRYTTRCRKPTRLRKFGSCDTLGSDIPSRQDWGSPPVGSWEVDMALSHRAPKLVALLAAACTGLLVGAQSAHAVWPGGNGKIVFWKFSGSMQSPQAQIYSMDSTGLNQVNLSAAGGGANQLDVQPSVSPNGKRIAFARIDPITFNTQIWTMKMDGSDQTNVTNNSATSESGPAWSANGSSILFVRQQSPSPPFGGFGSIWIRKANGSGTPRQLT
ncbi:MAG: hypothetical protein E6I70_16280, partial [Chloroflexi bacterium]